MDIQAKSFPSYCEQRRSEYGWTGVSEVDIDSFAWEWMTGSYGSSVVVLRNLIFTVPAPVHTLINSSHSHSQFTLTPTVHTHQFPLSPTVNKSSSFPSFLPAIVIMWVLNETHLTGVSWNFKVVLLYIYPYWITFWNVSLPFAFLIFKNSAQIYSLFF